MGVIDRDQEKALFEVKEFLVSIIGNAPYGIVAFDLEGEIILTNSFVIEHLGMKMSVNKAIGKNILDLTEKIPLLKTTIEKNMRKGRKKFNLPPLKINKRFMLVKGRSILNGTILVIEDITDLKSTEIKLEKQSKELSKANLKLQELDKMKSIFIASMSHELRTPLNSIIGFTGLLLQGLSGNIDEEAMSDLDIIYNSSKHLLNLINDVIDISKIESGKLDSHFESVKFDDVIEEVLSTVSKDAEKKDIKIKKKFPAGFIMVTDKRRLFQCILNLMSNAVKFTEKGVVELEVVKNSSVLKIAVKDTGIGIKKEDLPKLFKSFVRLDSPMETKTSGTGLGLYLSQKIMSSVFQGSISVKSVYGKGSVFTLSIPLNREV